MAQEGKLPLLPLFVDDYEAATTHLNLEEDGAYNRLLRLCWRQPDCMIPADIIWIMRRMRCDQKTYDRSVRPILEEFFTLEDQRYFQKRLLHERSYVMAVRQARREAGRKGGNAKASAKPAPSDEKTKPQDSKAKDLPEQDLGEALAPHPTPPHLTPPHFTQPHDREQQKAAADELCVRARDERNHHLAIDPAPMPEDDVRLYRLVLDAVGLGCVEIRKLPPYWRAPSAVVAVSRFRDLGLSAGEIVAVVKGSRINFSTPPDGPKAFERAMERYARVKAEP